MPYDAFALFRCGGVDFDSPVTSCAAFLLVFDGCEYVLEQPILLHVTEELSPFGPIDTDRHHLYCVRREERFHERRDFPWCEFGRALPREEFSHPRIACHITLAAQNAPVYCQCRKTDAAAVMRQGVKKGVRGAVVALGGIA